MGEPNLLIIFVIEIFNRVGGVFKRFVQLVQLFVAITVVVILKFMHECRGIVDVAGEFVEFP